MTVEQLRKALAERPFRPFTIVMGDGTRYRVISPEMVAMAPRNARSSSVTATRNTPFSASSS